jgi:hypothetical protein
VRAKGFRNSCAIRRLMITTGAVPARSAAANARPPAEESAAREVLAVDESQLGELPILLRCWWPARTVAHFARLRAPNHAVLPQQRAELGLAHPEIEQPSGFHV